MEREQQNSARKEKFHPVFGFSLELNISVVENATPETKGKGQLSVNPDNRFLRFPHAHMSMIK